MFCTCTFTCITYESNHQIRFNAYVLVALILKPPGMAIILESETAWSKENNIGQKCCHEHWYGQSRVNNSQSDDFTLLFQLSSAEPVLLSGFDHLHAVIVHEHNHSPSLLQGFQIILDPAVQQHGVFDAGIGSCQIAIFILAPVLF